MFVGDEQDVSKVRTVLSVISEYPVGNVVIDIVSGKATLLEYNCAITFPVVVVLTVSLTVISYVPEYKAEILSVFKFRATPVFPITLEPKVSCDVVDDIV